MTPEAVNDNKTFNGKGAEWWEKWAKLLAKLLAVKNTEQALDIGKTDSKRVGELLKVKQSGDDEFWTQLIGSLKGSDPERVKNLVENKIIEVEKQAKQRKMKPGEKGFVDVLVAEVESRSHEVEQADIIENNRKFEQLEKDVEGRKSRATEKLERVARKGSKDEVMELDRVRAELESMKPELSGDERTEQIEKSFCVWEDRVDGKIVRARKGREEGRLKAQKFQISKAHQLIEKYNSGELGDDELAGVEVKLLQFIMEHLDDELAGSGVREVLDEMLEDMSDEQRMGIVESMLENDETKNKITKGGKEKTEDQDAILNLLKNMMGLDVDKDPAKTKKRMERMGYGVGIDPEILNALNETLETDFGVKDALIKNSEFNLLEVNPALSKENKEKVNKLFQQELLESIRFMVDESVDLRQTQFEPRAVRYLTLMSVMGLDTRMKSVVMDRYQLQYFAFTFGNGYIDNEVTESFQKYFAKMGAEYNILDALKDPERMTVNVKGKEVEIGETNLYLWEKVMASKITDEADRRYFGLEDDQERTYATMMYRSNEGERKSLDRAVMVKQMLKLQLDSDKYTELVGKFDSEGEMAKAVGDKYWDYQNGVMVYWLGTQRMGEVIGNASPSGSEYVIASGMPEYYMKRVPLMWAVFTGVYNTSKAIELLEAISEMGISSLGSKEAKEVFTHFLNIDKNKVTQAPGITEVLLGGKSEESKLNLEKNEFAVSIQQAFIDALYVQKRYHLGKEMQKVSKNAPYYHDRPLKKKNGKLDVDTLSMRRDTATTQEMLLSHSKKWTDEQIEMWDWSWIKDNFKHDKKLLRMIGDESKLSQRQKVEYFLENFGDDYMMAKYLSAKRPDDTRKYAGAYWDDILSKSADLVSVPSWTGAIELLAKISSITGVGKIGPIRDRVFHSMEYMREERVLGEKVAYYESDEGGNMQYDSESWDGDLRGMRPLPKLRERKVTAWDVKNGKDGKASVLTIKGMVDAIDEPGDIKSVLRAMYASHLYTEQGYKEARKEYNKKMRSIDLNKPLWAEGWEVVSGKKLINYLAIEVFDMSPEMFVEWVMHNTKETFSPIWKYFNS